MEEKEVFVIKLVKEQIVESVLGTKVDWCYSLSKIVREGNACVNYSLEDAEKERRRAERLTGKNFYIVKYKSIFDDGKGEIVG